MRTVRSKGIRNRNDCYRNQFETRVLGSEKWLESWLCRCINDLFFFILLSLANFAMLCSNSVLLYNICKFVIVLDSAETRVMFLMSVNSLVRNMNWFNWGPIALTDAMTGKSCTDSFVLYLCKILMTFLRTLTIWLSVLVCICCVCHKTWAFQLKTQGNWCGKCAILIIHIKSLYYW